MKILIKVPLTLIYIIPICIFGLAISIVNRAFNVTAKQGLNHNVVVTQFTQVKIVYTEFVLVNVCTCISYNLNR